MTQRPPQGASPRLGRPPCDVQVIHDDEGQLTIYTGKFCAAPGCSVQLTSRNRYQSKLACMEHGREIERQRSREQRDLRASGALPAAKSRTVKKPVPGLPTIPDGLLTNLKVWLNHPADEFAQERLRFAMDEYELNARLRKLLPAATAAIPSIPVEYPLPIDSPHRLTQGEFLADCNTYGV